MLDLRGRRLVLASASPRRAQLLTLIGLTFDVVESELDEEAESFVYPEVQVLELSERKATLVAERIDRGVVVGADTIVVLEGEILGKPRDRAHAKAMLARLSGQTHQVYTGFTLVDTSRAMLHSDYEKTDVTFRGITEREIEAYVNTDKPLDKAGAYGIQDGSAIFVEKINGCFYNVMGFPVTKFYKALKNFLR